MYDQDNGMHLIKLYWYVVISLDLDLQRALVLSNIRILLRILLREGCTVNRLVASNSLLCITTINISALILIVKIFLFSERDILTQVILAWWLVDLVIKLSGLPVALENKGKREFFLFREKSGNFKLLPDSCKCQRILGQSEKMMYLSEKKLHDQCRKSFWTYIS